MALDDIQIREEDERVKPNESLSANSIKFKKKSLSTAEDKIRALKEARTAAIASLENVVNAIVDDVPENEIKNTLAMNYAMVIANLEQEINIIEGVQGPVELVQSRAIRLIDKMIKAAKENSKGIYSELAKKNGKDDTQSNIDVEKIATEVEEPLKNSIEEAVVEKESLEDSDIKEVFDESLGINTEHDNTVLERDEIERKINEKLNSYLSDKNNIGEEKNEPRERFEGETEEEYIKYLSEFYASPSSEEEYEYEPMTDEEIAKARENIEYDKYNKISETAAKNENAVNFKNMFAEIKMPEMPSRVKDGDVTIRDEVAVVPERKKIEEYTMVKDEPKKTTISPYFTEERKEESRSLSPYFFEKKETEKDDVKPKDMIITSDEKETLLQDRSLEELNNLILNAEKESEQHQQRLNAADEIVEEARKKNEEVAIEEAESEKKRAEVLAEEEESEKRLAELRAESERQARELKEMMIERVKTLNDKNKNLTATIQSREEEMTNINKDTENRREKISTNNRDTESRIEKISTINRDTASVQEEIERYKAMKMMLTEPEDDSKVEVKIVK